MVRLDLSRGIKVLQVEVLDMETISNQIALVQATHKVWVGPQGLRSLWLPLEQHPLHSSHPTACLLAPKTPEKWVHLSDLRRERFQVDFRVLDLEQARLPVAFPAQLRQDLRLLPLRWAAPLRWEAGVLLDQGPGARVLKQTVALGVEGDCWTSICPMARPMARRRASREGLRTLEKGLMH